MVRGIILFAISLVLTFVFAPIGLLFGFWQKDYLVNCALSIDQTGNVIMSKLFDKILLKRHQNHFGDPDQTISYVIGRNYIDNNLTPLGRAIRFILDFIEENHCLNAVLKEENGR